MSYIGGFKNPFFYFLGQRWRKNFWSLLVDNTFNDGFGAEISIFCFQLNEMRDEAKTWWLVSGSDVVSSYFFQKKIRVAFESRDSHCYRQPLLNYFVLSFIVSFIVYKYMHVFHVYAKAPRNTIIANYKHNVTCYQILMIDPRPVSCNVQYVLEKHDPRPVSCNVQNVLEKHIPVE